MSKLSQLLRVTPEEKKQILKHYNIIEDDFQNSLNILTDWLKKTTPFEEEKQKMPMVLLNSKLSLERAKQSIHGYYKVRKSYDYFEKMSTTSICYKDSKKYCPCIVSPKLTKDLCRVTLIQWKDYYGEAANCFLYCLFSFMIAEVRIVHDYCLSNIIVIDMKHYTLKNLLKFTPTDSQKLANIYTSVNLRLKSVHVINAPPFIERILLTMKLFLPPKLMTKIQIHSNPDELLDFIPKECLPSDYGGTEDCFDNLFDDWCNELENMEPFFEYLLNVKANTTSEDDQYSAEIFGVGSEGSFKKLSLD